MGIALIEKERSVDAGNFDKIIDFHEFSDASVDEYVSRDESDALYDETYASFCDWLHPHTEQKKFQYEGVDILQA